MDKEELIIWAVLILIIGFVVFAIIANHNHKMNTTREYCEKLQEKVNVVDYGQWSNYVNIYENEYNSLSAPEIIKCNNNVYRGKPEVIGCLKYGKWHTCIKELAIMNYTLLN